MSTEDRRTATDSEILEELRHLRARVDNLQRAAEVHELTSLVMAYGPLVDAGEADEVAALWTSDGIYEVDGVLTMEGREQIARMVLSDQHQSYIHGGAGHVLTHPTFHIDGDTAIGYNHALLITLSDGEYSIIRVSANEWVFTRTASGWRISRRTNRPLDGRASARELFGAAVSYSKGHR